jgi:hypothetical protein
VNCGAGNVICEVKEPAGAAASSSLALAASPAASPMINVNEEIWAILFNMNRTPFDVIRTIANRMNLGPRGAKPESSDRKRCVKDGKNSVAPV